MIRTDQGHEQYQCMKSVSINSRIILAGRREIGLCRLPMGFAPVFQQQVEQPAGDGDESQPLGQFDAALEQRVGDGECQQISG